MRKKTFSVFIRTDRKILIAVFLYFLPHTLRKNYKKKRTRSSGFCLYYKLKCIEILILRRDIDSLCNVRAADSFGCLLGVQKYTWISEGCVRRIRVWCAIGIVAFLNWGIGSKFWKLVSLFSTHGNLIISCCCWYWVVMFMYIFQISCFSDLQRSLSQFLLLCCRLVLSYPSVNKMNMKKKLSWNFQTYIAIMFS